MVTVTNIRNVRDGEYDEVWAVVRSNKNLLPGAKHVPELSPSWELFSKYRKWKEQGDWDEGTFQSVYVPQFLKEMESPKAQGKLKELIEKSNAGMHVCIYCFCPGTLCHRFVLAGILESKTDVCGVPGGCSGYGSRYWASLEKAGAKEGKAVAFTGPRPKILCGYGRDAYKPFVAQLAAMLKIYYEDGFREFITGGAQGFDQLAFWAARRLKEECPDICLTVYVPFSGQESIWAKEGCFSQADYHKMIALADRVECLQEEKPETKRGVVHALFWRNERMVDDADAVIALCNEDGWRNASGGTAGCMQYASRRAKPIHRIMYQDKPYLYITGSECIQ